MDQWANVVGTAHGAFDPWRYLEERIGRPVERERIEAKRRARELAIIKEQEVKPGVLNLIHEAKAGGLGVGLATSSRRDWVERHLRRFGILELFESVATADDVKRVKPDPALYTLAVKQLVLKTNEAVAIEDSPNGALGAKRAGLACVVVPNDVTKSYPFPMADACWNTLEGASLSDLHAVWQNARENLSPSI